MSMIQLSVADQKQVRSWVTAHTEVMPQTAWLSLDVRAAQEVPSSWDSFRYCPIMRPQMNNLIEVKTLASREKPEGSCSIAFPRRLESASSTWRGRSIWDGSRHG